MRLRPSALQLGTTQQGLLRQLLWHPNGLGVEQLCDKLHISHNAVRQHLTALGTADLVKRVETRTTGGRPGAVSRLPRSDANCFRVITATLPAG